MTEDEAKTKWCPMVRMGAVLNEGVAAVNRVTQAQGDKANCIGSACMMWKFKPEMVNVSTSIAVDWLKPTGKMTDDGYCGLAGRL